MTTEAKTSEFDRLCVGFAQLYKNAKTPEEREEIEKKVNTRGQGMLLEAAAKDGHCTFFHMILHQQGYPYLTQDILETIFLGCDKGFSCPPCYLLSVDRHLIETRAREVLADKSKEKQEEAINEVLSESREQRKLPFISEELIRRKISILVGQGEFTLVRYFKRVVGDTISEDEQTTMFNAIFATKDLYSVLDFVKEAPFPISQEQTSAISQLWLEKEGIRIK